LALLVRQQEGHPLYDSKSLGFYFSDAFGNVCHIHQKLKNKTSSTGYSFFQ